MKARTIRTWEGAWLNLNDLKRGCQSEALMQDCILMLKVGKDRGASAAECMKVAVGAFLIVMSGEAHLLSEQASWKAPEYEI